MGRGIREQGMLGSGLGSMENTGVRVGVIRTGGRGVEGSGRVRESL